MQTSSEYTVEGNAEDELYPLRQGLDVWAGTKCFKEFSVKEHQSFSGNYPLLIIPSLAK